MAIRHLNYFGVNEPACGRTAAVGGPVESGDYESRLMRDDGYVTLAVSEPFSVSEPP